ncbi:MAG: hypothetical protein Q9190_006301 [Brigantiaea leucoxantha]
MAVVSVVDIPAVHAQQLATNAVDPTIMHATGHISRDCTAPNGGPLNSAGKACYKCGQPGHISRECTSVDANGPIAMDAGVDGVNQVQANAPTAAVV